MGLPSLGWLVLGQLLVALPTDLGLRRIAGKAEFVGTEERSLANDGRPKDGVALHVAPEVLKVRCTAAL
jgi:hypothetical protein